MYKVPDSMRVGPPVLRVRNIDTAIAFYENAQNTNADQYLIEAAENIKRINKCKT